MTDDEHREALVDLQSRLAFQDHTINELNGVITDQQRQIDQLALQVKILSDKLTGLEDAIETGHPGHDAGHEKPPHY